MGEQTPLISIYYNFDIIDIITNKDNKKNMSPIKNLVKLPLTIASESKQDFYFSSIHVMFSFSVHCPIYS